MSYVVIDPHVDRAAEGRALGAALVANQPAGVEQFQAAMDHALAAGFAVELAEQLANLTMGDGPWLLHADGTVTGDVGI